MRVITDIHGRDKWKEVKNNTKDKIIFLGDYVDTHEDITNKEQLDNLLEIIEFKKENMDKVVLLYGNHDFHYLHSDTFGMCSGYSGKKEKVFKPVFLENRDLFKIIHIEDDVIFSHAGISQVWFDRQKLKDIENINKLHPINFRHANIDPYGDSSLDSPLWIRPDSLVRTALKGYKQVVGHTYMEEPEERGDILFLGEQCGVFDLEEIKNERKNKPRQNDFLGVGLF